jgi:outer membrane usher protein
MGRRRRHSHICRSLAVAVFAVIALRTGAASAATEDGARPLQLDITIGGEKTGLLGSFLQLTDGSIAAHRSELVEAGVKVPGSGPPEELIVLNELLGDRFKYDEPAQSISFDLDNNERIARAFDAMGSSAPRTPVSTAWGSVLNYTLFGSETSGLNPRNATFSGASASLDARAFSPYGTLSQTGIIGTTTTRDMTMLRLDTAFSYSHPDSLVTYRVGDSISGSLAWTRSVRFAGIQAQRNFALRSDLVTAPLPSFSGSAAVPSTLDVYLNNSKTYTQEVPPGPFQVNNLPLISGGEARLVLRDSAGREVETTLPFYTSPQLLREGLTYFSMETGFPRLSYGIDSNNYAPKEMVSFSARYGMYDWLTLEGHAEGVAGLYNGGAGMLVRTGDFGVLSAAASGSTYQGQHGLQTYVAFETKLWGVSINASSTRTFMDYSDIASVTAPVVDTLAAYSITGAANPAPTNAAPAKAIDRISLGYRLPDLSSLALSLVHLEPASGALSNLVSVAWSRSFYLQSQLFVTSFADLSNRGNYGIFAGISIPIGDNSSVSTGATSSRSGTSLTTDASRPLGMQTGSYGARVRDSEGAVPYRSASASYRAAPATVEVGVEQSQGTVLRGTGQVDGAVAAMGGGVFFSNRIDDAFAVVDAGVPGVPVLHENRLVGETNDSGKLLVPNLRAYGNNKISIDPKGLPVNAEVATVEDVVAPADRSGVLVNFATKSDVQAAIVILVDAAGKPLAVGSKGKLDGGSDDFIVGYDGRAFIKDLKSANTVTVTLEKGECHAAFDYASSQGSQVVVGPISCQ